MARIGLVLGAGGITGGAFHAGVLAALAEATGWDPRSAEVIVGTSAGAVTAAAMRAGLPAADLAARTEGRPLSAEGAAVLAAAGLGAGPTPVPGRPSRAGRPGRLPSALPAAPRALIAAALQPWRVRPTAVMAGLMPAGTVPTSIISDGIDALFGHGWPSQPLWICAVRLDDGRLAVFGREGAPGASVGEAVAASCAIPGYFAPVKIGGARYVDGGAHSLANLAQVARAGLDLVLVSAPMSRAGRRRFVAGGVLREAGRAQLELEAQQVRRRGAHVIAFQPTTEDQSTMGLDAMDPRRGAAVVRQARASTLRRLERADVRERLAPLTRS